MPTKVEKIYTSCERQVACRDCGQEWTAQNALAVGFHHARAFGHVVDAETRSQVTYRPEEVAS